MALLAIKKWSYWSADQLQKQLNCHFLFQKESEERWRNKIHHLTCPFPFFLQHKPFKYCWIFAVFLSWKKEKLLRNMMNFISSTFLAKEKEIFCQSLRWQKSSSTLLSFGYWGLLGAGFLPVQCYYLAFCHGLVFWVYQFGIAAFFFGIKRHHQGLGVLISIGRCFVGIFCFLFISGFAGLLPVFSCVLKDKSLIINTIHFCSRLRWKSYGY